MVTATEMIMKRPLMQYRGDTHVPFIKITVQDQRSLPKVRDESSRHRFLLIVRTYGVSRSRVFERGMLQFRDLQLGTATFESNIPYTLRFMIDTKVSAMCAIVGCMANDMMPASRHELDRSPCWAIYTTFKSDGPLPAGVQHEVIDSFTSVMFAAHSLTQVERICLTCTRG